MYNPIVNMSTERLGTVRTPTEEHPEGPWRRIEVGETVNPNDIRVIDGVPHVHTRRGGLTPEHPSPRRAFAGVPVLGTVADIVGNIGDSMPWSRKSRQAGGAPRGHERYSGKNRKNGQL